MVGLQGLNLGIVVLIVYVRSSKNLEVCLLRQALDVRQTGYSRKINFCQVITFTVDSRMVILYIP